ncbi:PD40 domain-containing protein [Streptacidiphilus melanogenes]|uniref:PD40 domain-containing protein n=1 Tax=Streptacidiphilus melanogenes TaxID=411235 RepID=UPI0005A78B56|nr:PD40 domain-containing protein [Streptacidiphilus melanogenes]
MRTRRIAVAIALVSAVTASGLLTACDPKTGTGAAASASPTQAASGGASASTPTGGTGGPGGTGGASGTGGTSGGSTGGSTGGRTGAPVSVNGTGGTMLTISNGTTKVVMNGAVVDFGVVVRDLAWSPDGRRAAFIDGNGNLDTANADGSGRVVVARNPGGQTWSHPAWQVVKADPGYGNMPRNNLFFVAGSGAGSVLMEVPTTGGKPARLSLAGEAGSTAAPLPQTGNTWINGSGTTNGTTVYANTGTGDVYIRDDYIRQQGSVMTNGSEPAPIPGQVDEGVVFVRSVGGHDHIFVEHFGTSPAGSSAAGTTAVDITPHATTDYTEPAVSPDGRTVAVRTPNGVAVLPIDGSAAPKLISSVPGLPAYR